MSNKEKVSYYAAFLQRKRLDAQQKRQEKLRQERQIQEKKHQQIGNFQIEDHMVNNEGVNDNIVEEGQLLRVVETTLIESEFIVQCLYKGQKMKAIASREQIIKQNISALLDFYENSLNLKDRPFFSDQ